MTILRPDDFDPRDIRRVYGRRQTRSLSAGKKTLFDQSLAQLQIPADLLKRGKITAPDLFSKPVTGLWLEIGFGNGEHLKLEMLAHPDTGFIGAEPFINGMAGFLKSIEGEDQSNVRVYMDDAMTVVDALADASLDGIFVLNPDPWPKKRHHKRRIIQPDHVTKFARIIKPGGKLIMTTDIDELAEWMCTHAANNPDFCWTANTPKDWQTPPAGWIPTKYERKGAAKGRNQTYLVFERLKS